MAEEILDRPTVRVSEIGEYIRHRSCDRRFRLEVNRRHEARQLPFAERLFNALDPVLQEEGRDREIEWERSLTEAGVTCLVRPEGRPEDGDVTFPDWNEFAGRVSSQSQGDLVFGREVAISYGLGAFRLQGRIDFLILLWRNGAPVLRIVECKASRRDRTYQRIQVCIYKLMLTAILEETPLIIAGHELRAEDIECVVARIDESTNENQQILALPALDVEMETADLERLLAADGHLSEVFNAELHTLSYQLDDKCDGCVFNVHCFPESGLHHRLELLSISPSSVRSLQAAGVTSLDALAELDVDSPEALALRSDVSFSDHLESLATKARVRRRTLPGGDQDPDTYDVETLPNRPTSQLPEHVQNDRRLVRIFLAVDYDYTENRIGALSAHVTRSDGLLTTGFSADEVGRFHPNPVPFERVEVGQDAAGRTQYEERALRGTDVIVFKTSEWTGDLRQDTGAERELIQNFISQLIDAIADVAAEETTALHFYVWSRSEVAQLVEACSRSHSRLLGALREVMGCRESLEQLIYSCLADEVDRRYALAWTGRGLGVVSSLRWFGQIYHWRRIVSGAEVSLDQVFTQDIFDFKTDLDLNGDVWARTEREATSRHKFEIRSRFHDSLTAPYWRAVWGTLSNPNDPTLAPNVRNAITRYNQAAEPNRMREYLRARTHALRWIEEKIRPKNSEIAKPELNIAELRRFSLNIDNAAQAAVDFLRLDHHVKLTDWIAEHLIPPVSRVPNGRTVPVTEVTSDGNSSLTAVINLEGFSIDLDTLSMRCPFEAGSFVRLVPAFDDHHRGQTVSQLLRGSRTCVIDTIDWGTGQVTMSEMYNRPSRYVLLSGHSDAGIVFENATIDESVTDFVAGGVEERLLSGVGSDMFGWFDPENPQIPPITARDSRVPEVEPVLRDFHMTDGSSLSPDQVQAVVDGVGARIHLLQGPPGTGKTMATTLAALVRIGAFLQEGDVVLLASHTHTAVDNLLRRIRDVLPVFRAYMAERGIATPEVTPSKVFSSVIEDRIPGITNFVSRPSATVVNGTRTNAVMVIGGTTRALLQLARELDQRRPWVINGGFRVPLLIVDEASMMVFPHFLALATILRPDGQIVLAGDHRQLSPILAHDWEREDRPPAVLYQPFASAYDAVRDIAANPGVLVSSARTSALSFTFRLPPPIRELVARLYRLDDIELDGLPGGEAAAHNEGGVRDGLNAVWEGPTGLYLVMHDEGASRQSNELEAQIIQAIIAAAPAPDAGSVAVLTPHRAQRALLRQRLAGMLEVVDVIDTVERLQGGERPTVVVSGTASDHSVISSNAEFLLDLNRSNVAFSRARNRLIVICSRNLLDHIPADLEQYQSALLWKSLRALCSRLVAATDVGGFRVEVFTPPINAPLHQQVS